MKILTDGLWAILGGLIGLAYSVGVSPMHILVTCCMSYVLGCCVAYICSKWMNWTETKLRRDAINAEKNKREVGL